MSLGDVGLAGARRPLNEEIAVVVSGAKRRHYAAQVRTPLAATARRGVLLIIRPFFAGLLTVRRR